MPQFYALDDDTQPNAPQGRVDVRKVPPVEGATAAQFYNFEQQPGVIEDFLRSLGTGAIEGVNSSVGMLGDYREGVRDLGGALIDKIAPGGGNILREGGALDIGQLPFIDRAPSSSELNTDIQGRFGQFYQPQTMAGEYGRTIGQFAPAAVAPGSATGRVANVLAPALLSEAGGQLTQGTPLEPLARIGGGVAGSLIGAGVNSGSPVDRILRRDTKGVSDQQLALAEQLMRDSPVRLTGAEAVQQVTGGTSGLGTRQRILEGTAAGREAFNPVMAQRPAEVQAAGRALLDQIAPPSANPSLIGVQAQSAAEEALNRVRQSINARAGADYTALQGQRLPAGDMAQLMADPSYARALGEIRGNPELAYRVASLPDDDLSVVNEVVKQLDALKEAATPSAVNPTGNFQLSSRRGEARALADALASNVSPEWRSARDTVSAGLAAELDPLRAGPLGAVANSADLSAQTRALYPSNPFEGAANETTRALREVGQPVGADLTRQYLARVLNESTQNLQGGANQYGGAKFAATVAGNPEQRSVLQAGVSTVAPNAELARVLDAFEATGKRQAPGSQTAYNIEELKNLGEGGAIGTGVRAASSVPFNMRQIGDWLQKAQLERNAKGLSEVLLDSPEGFAGSVRRSRSGGRYEGSLLSALLAAQLSGNQ